MEIILLRKLKCNMMKEIFVYIFKKKKKKKGKKN